MHVRTTHPIYLDTAELHYVTRCPKSKIRLRRLRKKLQGRGDFKSSSQKSCCRDSIYVRHLQCFFQEEGFARPTLTHTRYWKTRGQHIKKWKGLRSLLTTQDQMRRIDALHTMRERRSLLHVPSHLIKGQDRTIICWNTFTFP